MCVALALLLSAAGWKAHVVARLDAAGVRAADAPSPSRIDYLRAAAALAPNDADLLAELGNVCLKEFEKQQGQKNADPKRLARDLLVPGLRAYLQARDACPVLCEVQLGIAAHVADLASADPQRAICAVPSCWRLWTRMYGLPADCKN